MSCDAIDLLRLAQELLNAPNPTEATARTVISRSYYAVFLAARHNLSTAGVVRVTGSGRDHRAVIEAVQRNSKFVGDVLDSLRDQRNRADYDLTVGFSAEFARQATELAEWVYDNV